MVTWRLEIITLEWRGALFFDIISPQYYHHRGYIMKILISMLLMITCFSALALDLDAFEAKLEQDLALGRVEFDCSYHMLDLEEIYEDGRNVARAHKVEEDKLPKFGQTCDSAVQNALDKGVTKQEILAHLNKQIEIVEMIRQFADDLTKNPDMDIEKAIINLKQHDISFSEVKAFSGLADDDLFLVKLTYMNLRTPFEKRLDRVLEDL